MAENEKQEIYRTIDNLSSTFNSDSNECAIILAAGHGKRIKSHTSKMLHKIWGTTTVERVYNACKNGIDNLNSIIVVGIKAKEVMETIGTKENNLFAYQEIQNGTGHAVQVALDKIKDKSFTGTVYVLPGDMGLLNKETVIKFKNEFESSGSDMMVLTGIFEGDSSENAYGRIIRVKAEDKNGNSSGKDQRNVIEIMEHKDILALNENEPYEVEYKGKTYSYSKKELIENSEFNSGVYAFKYDKLTELIKKLSSDNAQGEIYVTDLIYLFNNSGYSVQAVSPDDQHVVMGFNTKSVLKEMEDIARKIIYNKIKDIVMIEDPDDFFIHDHVVEQIIENDDPKNPLDIFIGKGVSVGENVKLSSGAIVKRNSELKGNVEIGEGTEVGSNCKLVGTQDFPLKIGKNVNIGENCYLFGSVIEDEVQIVESIIVRKKIERKTDKDGNVIPIKYYKPEPAGIELIKNL